MFYLIASFLLTSDTTYTKQLPVYKMEEVVVTATRIPDSLYDLPTNVTVITRDMIANSNVHTVADIIEYALGITDVGKQGTRGATSNVRIRSGGEASKQVLVMINGQSINDVSLGGADLDEILTDYVEKIEIVRGPNSVLYGANALGGVINIITKNSLTDSPFATFQTSIGSFATQKHTLNFGIQNKKLNTFFTVNRDVSDGWRKNSDYGGNDFEGTLKRNFDYKQSLELNFLYHNSNFGVPGQNNTPVEEYDGKKEINAQSPYAREHRQRECVQLEYENGVTQNTLFKIKSYGNLANKRYEDPVAFMDAPIKTFTYGAETQINTIYSILLGIDMHRDECKKENFITSPHSIDINEKIINKSIFLQKIQHIGKSISVLGFRYDYHSVFGCELSPRFSFTYHILDNLKFSGNIGHAFRAPTFEDLYSPYSSWPASPYGNAGDIQGNAELKPERSWGGDVGLEYQFRNIFLWQVTFFKSDVSDLIQWADVSSSIYYEEWRPSNIGRAYNQGFEVQLTHNFFQYFSHSLQCNYLESKGKDEMDINCQTLMYTVPFRLNYMVNYANNSGLNINIKTNFTEEIKWEDNYGITHKLPPYGLLDINISQKVENMKMFFTLRNVFDKRYQSREYYPLPGRNFNIGVTVTL